MSASCEIVVKGHLDTDWSGWLEGLTVIHSDQGTTILSGHIRDQAALYGVFAKIRDMALFIISVKYMVDEPLKQDRDPEEHP